MLAHHDRPRHAFPITGRSGPGHALLALCLAVPFVGCADIPVAPEGPAEPRAALATLQPGSSFTVQSLGLTGDQTSYYWPAQINARGQVLLFLRESGQPTLLLFLWEEGVLRPAIPAVPTGSFVARACLANDGTVVYTLSSGGGYHLVRPDGAYEKRAIPSWIGGGVIGVTGCNARGDILFGTFALYREEDFHLVPLPGSPGVDQQLFAMHMNEAGHFLYTYISTVSSEFSYFVHDGVAEQSVPITWPNNQDEVIAFNAGGAMLISDHVIIGGTLYPLPPPPADASQQTFAGANDLNDLTQVVGQSYRYTPGTGQVEYDVVIWTHAPPSPSAQIGSLTESLDQLVADGALEEGTAASLTMKLNAADRMIAAGKTAAAMGQLEGFLRQMTGLMNAGRIDPAVGQSLLDAVGRIRSAIS